MKNFRRHGNAPFEKRYAADIMKTRLSRLSDNEVSEVNQLVRDLESGASPERNSSFARFGELMMKADSFDPLPQENDILDYQYETYQRVWTEAEQFRSNSRFLKLREDIKSPVVSYPW